MSISDNRIGWILSFLLLFTACGLADDRDEEDKYVYIRFSDGAFEKYALANHDLNGDGRVSRYEAQRVVEMDCSSLGIESMSEISEFSNLRVLQCNDNLLLSLDLRKCPFLERVGCAGNKLTSLDVNGLRALLSLNCSDNSLSGLQLGTNSSLRTLICSDNALTTLDVSVCSLNFRELDTRGNKTPFTLYRLAAQQFDSILTDPGTEIVAR